MSHSQSPGWPAPPRTGQRRGTRAGTAEPDELRVTLLSEYFHPDRLSSTGRLFSALSSALVNEHHSLRLNVIAGDRPYRGGPHYARRETWKGVGILRCAALPLDRSRASLRLLADISFTAQALGKLLVQPPADLNIVGSNPPLLPVVATIDRLLRRVPYLYVVHDVYPDIAVAVGALAENGRATRWLARLQRWMLASSSRIVVLGRCMRDFLAERYEIEPAKLRVIANWPDIQGNPEPSEVARLRERLGGGRFILLYAGNLGRFQDFDTVLDASRVLASGPVPARVVFVGDGAQRQRIAERVMQEGISNVLVLPPVGDRELPALLAAAHAGLVTLEPGAEGLGVPSKLYNLMAAGRPVLAVVGAASEVARVIREHDCGRVVRPGDARGLADAVNELATAPAECERLGCNAQAAARNQYGFRRALDTYYETILAAAGRLAPISRPSDPVTAMPANFPKRSVEFARAKEESKALGEVRTA